MYDDVIRLAVEMKTGLKMAESESSAAEKSMDEVAEFIGKKATKQEQDAFIHQVLFGMG